MRGSMPGGGGWVDSFSRTLGLPTKFYWTVARGGTASIIGLVATVMVIAPTLGPLIGGVLDGNAMVKLAMWAQGKSLYTGSGFVSEIKPEHRLSTANPSFRGNVSVAENQRQGIAVLSLPSGVVLQDLPFDIELKKFNVEYYPTGMPKSFASDIVIHDGGQTREATVKVNEPVIHQGLAIYQSSFEDGGSKLRLLAQPLASAGTPLPIEGRVGTRLAFGDQMLELDGLRVHAHRMRSEFGHRGLGSASCGPDVLPQYRITPGTYRFAYRLSVPRD